MDIPADLVDLQRAFFAADAECERLAGTRPDGRDVAAGTAEISAEQRAEMDAAHAERLRLVEAIHRHPWWAKVDNRHEARTALRAAASGSGATDL